MLRSHAPPLPLSLSAPSLRSAPVKSIMGPEQFADDISTLQKLAPNRKGRPQAALRLIPET
jgi:hypothetical protein